VGRSVAILVSVGLLLASSSGCLLNRTNRKVVRQDEARQGVQFESNLAQSAFTQAATDESKREAEGDSSGIYIPFLLAWGDETVLSPAAYYNDQIMLCDANGDGLITEAEAWAYNPDYMTSRQESTTPTSSSIQFVDPSNARSSLALGEG